MNDNDLSRELGGALERGLTALTEQSVFWLPRLLIAVLVILVALRVGRWIGALASRPFRSATPTVEQFVRRVTHLVFGVVGFALALNVLGLGAFAAGILASGSIVAIVLGFAFQEIGTNLIAGVFLAFNRPFRVGDIIECDGFQGVVLALDLRTTHIRNYDGRDIFIPNATIFTNTLINYTVDKLRRRSFQIGIQYEDDAGAAMELLARNAMSASGVLEEPVPVAVIVELANDTVQLEVAYWVSMEDPPDRRAQIGADVMDRCRRALLEHGYTISANVSTAVDLTGGPREQPIHVDLQRLEGPA